MIVDNRATKSAADTLGDGPSQASPKMESGVGVYLYTALADSSIKAWDIAVSDSLQSNN